MKYERRTMNLRPFVLKFIVRRPEFRISYRGIIMLKKRFILGLLALAALALTAGDGARAQSRPELTEEFHQTYALAAGGRLSLSNINGSVKVVAWDRDELKVDAVKRAYLPERLREAQIRVDATAGRVRIETEYPEYRWTREMTRYENPASVDYTLTVPRGATVDEINLINGDLDIAGLTGSVRASSINGRVTAGELSGPVKLSVINGALEMKADRLGDAGSVSLEAVNGPLSVVLPSDANATVHASTVHGGINNDFNLPVRRGEYVGRDLEGRLGRGGARVRLSNVNGSISVRRASDNKPLSQVTNLLSETRGREDFDDDDDDSDPGEAAREAADEAREAVREAADAAREAADEVRERERERRENLTEAERERRDEARERAREHAREARERADEARERVRAQREVAVNTREIERAAREAERAARSIDKEDFKNDIKEGVRAGTGRDSARQIERESNTFNVSGATRVRVETFDGPVSVHAWDKAEVMYTATKRATDEREMKGIKLTANNAGGEVTLRADFDKSFARVYHEHDGRVTSYVSNASAEFDLYVPRNATLFVSSGDGRLRVEGVSGEVELRTGDGSIDVTGSRGRLRAETGDGRIRVEDFDGEADARTGDGRITLDGNFKGLTAHTGDGAISLVLPEGVNATVETNAESVYNDGVAVAEGGDSESRVRRWKVGGGGQLFTLRTGDGSISLRRR
jgi:DUF4097 and DUF4098 domain-containing protein YvlB